MLVLSRKMGQELVIGENIRITVSRIGGNRVTLGIMAPNDVRIVRGELEPIVRSFEIELDEVPAAEVTASRLPGVSSEPLAATWSPESAPLVDLSRQLH